MNRLGLGLASTALVVLSACGGSDQQEQAEATATEVEPSSDLLSVEQSCTQAEMINKDVGGEPGSWSIPTFGKYGGEIALLSRQSVPEIADVLQPVGQQAIEIGLMSGDDDSVGDEAGVWATKYQDLVDICARTDAPIARLNN